MREMLLWLIGGVLLVRAASKHVLIDWFVCHIVIVCALLTSSSFLTSYVCLDSPQKSVLPKYVALKNHLI
jgi:hypothetical protein